MSPGVIDARGYLRGVIVAGVNVARVNVVKPKCRVIIHSNFERVNDIIIQGRHQ